MGFMRHKRREREFGLNPHFDGAAGKPDQPPVTPELPADANRAAEAGQPTQLTDEQIVRAFGAVVYPRGLG